MATQDWQDRTLRDLIEHIVSYHHAFTRSALGSLVPLANEVARDHGGRHPYLLEVHSLLRELEDDMQSHLASEEQVLFPFVEELDIASRTSGRRPQASHAEVIDEPLRSLLFEHDHAGDVLKVLRATTNDYSIPPDADASYSALFEGILALEADLVRHMELEEQVLIPRAKALAGL
jgi:regulator of cell morphogenesis and NO signaling